MVGIVIVSHSAKLAEGVIDAARIMAADCPMAAAGGADDGGYGTSIQKVKDAVLSVYGPDGVMILADMGSAVMTAEMAIEDLGYADVMIADCPVAEGAVAGAVASICGDDLNSVITQAEESRDLRKC